MKQLTLAVAAMAVLISPMSLAQEELPAVGRQAPIFRLPVYNAAAVGSSVVGLDRLVGPDATDKNVKVVLMSFMASFCAPCKKEMPYLQMLHDKYKDFGLRVIMVSIDTEPEGQQIINDLIALNKVTFPVLKDRFNLVARRWLGNKSPLPSVFMIKPDGTVSMVHRGYNDEASQVFSAEVEDALGIKRGAAAVAEAPAASEGTQVASGAEPAAVKPAAATTSGKPVKKKTPKKQKAPRTQAP